MLRKLKNMLGIESVKIALNIPEEINKKDGAITGKIIFSSQTDQEVEMLTLKLIEKYQRGRNDSKLINEYLLGSIELQLDLLINAGIDRSFDFTLPFNPMLSEMDQIEKRNVFLRPFVKAAKKLKNVKSTFTLVAEAKVKGAKLHPLDKKKVVFK